MFKPEAPPLLSTWGDLVCDQFACQWMIIRVSEVCGQVEIRGTASVGTLSSILTLCCCCCRGSAGGLLSVSGAEPLPGQVDSDVRVREALCLLLVQGLLHTLHNTCCRSLHGEMCQSHINQLMCHCTITQFRGGSRNIAEEIPNK